MNKGELRAHLIALLNRSDCTNALADTFIDQALARITRAIRIPSMEKQQTYAISDVSGTGAIQMPTDLIEAIDIYCDGTALVRIPLHEMVEGQKTGEIGNPKFFARVQASFLIHPKPSSGTIYLNYYGEFAALSSDSSTNALTTVGSDLIIYTALSYAADYFIDERSQTFEMKANSFLSEIQEQADTAEISGGTQVMRPSQTYDD